MMGTKKLGTMGLMAASVAGLLACASAAQAKSIEITGVTTTFASNRWDYAYVMTLTAGNSISSTNLTGSSLFVFFDMTGLTGVKASFDSGITPSASWTVIPEATSGVWVAGQSFISSQGGTALQDDSASLENVRFQYTGPAFSAGNTNATLGVAHIYSTTPPTDQHGVFTARWIGNFGMTQVNTQSPLMPLGAGAVQSVPVPSAVWAGLSTLAGIGFFAGVRRRAMR